MGTLNVRDQMRSGTVPAARVATGTFGVARIPSIPVDTKTTGSLATTRVKGTLGIGRGPSVLGTVLKQRTISVTLPGFSLYTGSFIRCFQAQPPAGRVARVWVMGVQRTTGSPGLGSLWSVVYSESQGTRYRRGTAQYLTGSPLVTVPSGTRFSFRLENQTGTTRTVTGYFYATYE